MSPTVTLPERQSGQTGDGVGLARRAPGPLNALAPSVMSPVIESRGWMMRALASAAAAPPWLLAAA
jgi:hypothetical protein